MDKPLILKKKDFIQKLQEVVTESGLPAFLMIESVQSLLIKLKEIEQQELYKATKEYEESQKQD